MGWLEDALRNYAQARQKLNRQQGDPDAPALLSPEEAADPTDALTLLVQGYQKYLKRSGRQQDPMLDQTRSRHRGNSTLVEELTPGKLLPAADGEAFRVTSHGPRQGMVHQRYDVGGGRLANVYYDPKTGRREVVRFRG
jgi:hypothetical protein